VPDARRITFKEILSVCHARHADSLLVYRPDPEALPALSQVAERIPTVSLVHPVPHSLADSVLIDPETALRGLLRDRLDRGKRVFAFLAWQRDSARWQCPTCPHARLRNAFHSVLSEAGVTGLEFVSQADTREQAHEEVIRATANLSEDAVLVGVPMGVPGWLARPGARFDRISYTEFSASFAMDWHNRTVMFMSMEACARTAGRLLGERMATRAPLAARTVTLQPVVSAFGG